MALKYLPGRDIIMERDPALRESKAAGRLISICCGKRKPTMSPLRKQGSRAKKLDSRFRGNDKYRFRDRY